jgi:hypothetical protein
MVRQGRIADMGDDIDPLRDSAKATIGRVANTAGAFRHTNLILMQA